MAFFSFGGPLALDFAHYIQMWILKDVSSKVVACGDSEVGVMKIQILMGGLLTAGLLQSCGVAETTVAAGAAGGSVAQQAEQARKQMEQVRKDIDQAQEAAAARLRIAEEEASR
jgi:hypothetical protein